MRYENKLEYITIVVFSFVFDVENLELIFKKQRKNNSILGLINASIHTQFRPHFGMFFKTQLLETSKGRDLGAFKSEFSFSVFDFFSP